MWCRLSLHAGWRGEQNFSTCVWHGSKCPLSSWVTTTSVLTRPKSASLWHSCSELYCVCVLLLTQVQHFKGVCVCSGSERCGSCHPASSSYVICHTGSRQAPFNLYWGTDKWAMTPELFLLGDRSRDWWSAGEGRREKKKLFSRERL